MHTFRHALVFNIVGVIVLLIGIGSASLVYRRAQPAPATATTTGEWKDSSLALTDSKISTRNIELYGGKVEVLMVRWMDRLQRPESLAIIIATISVLIALGCFLVARHLSAARWRADWPAPPQT